MSDCFSAGSRLQAAF